MAGDRRYLPLIAAGLLLAMLAPTPVGAWPDAVRVVVPLDTLGPERLADAVAETGGEIVRVDQRLEFAVVSTPRPDQLEDRLAVQVQPDAEAAETVQAGWLDAPADPRYSDQWGPRYLDMHQAWGLEDGDPAVTVAVIDSGINVSHPDIDPAQVRFGHDYVEDDEVPKDERGHGTHVAGIVMATRDNREGIAGMADVTVLAIRVLNATGKGFCSDVASGVREAVDEGAEVINLSLSCTSDHQPLHEALRDARDAGVLVVAAAGNHWDARQALKERCVVHPARYPEALAVGAVKGAPGVAGTTLSVSASSFSCRGPEVELAAPGEDILSTTGGGYASWSGTSMAAAHVSATAALVLSATPGLTAEQVRARLATTADDLGQEGRDEAYGHGMVDPVEAIGGSPVPTAG